MSKSPSTGKPDCTMEEALRQNEAWDVTPSLNPATEPWFPTDFEIDWSSYNILDPAYDPNLISPQDFLAFPTYLPPVNYYPEPEVHYESNAIAHVPDDGVNEGFRNLERMVTELVQVKSELEVKVQQLTRSALVRLNIKIDS